MPPSGDSPIEADSTAALGDLRSPDAPRQSALRRITLDAAPDVPAHIADLVLDQCNTPDASSATLIVPDLRAAPGLRRAFGPAAARRGHSLCLPPRIITMHDALAQALPARSIEPPARRAERLYGMVRGHGWYQRESLWDTCAAVIALADELGDVQAATLTEGEWQRAIRAAYKRGVEHADSREARLVWEVWHAESAGTPPALTTASTKAASAEPLVPTVFNAMALQALGTKGCGPLFMLDPGRMPARWVHALEQAAAHTPVTLIALAPPLWSRQVWRDVGSAPVGQASTGAAPTVAAPIVSTPAQSISAASAPVNDDAAAAPNIPILAADSLEAEAAAVEAQVCAWLAQGKRQIALIAFDTLVARRARALLERRQVLLADEAGWRLSTTSAATAVMRWIEAVLAGLPSRTVLDWLKSPYVLGDIERAQRESATAAIEDAVHRHDVARFTPALLQAADFAPAAVALIERLLAVEAAWPRGEQTFAAWMAALDAALDQLGIRTPLGRDAAGAEVLALLTQVQTCLAPARKDAARVSVGEWRIFLAAQFEAASFRNRLIDSPVVLTTLEGAQWRSFDAVLLVGAGAAHLNARAPDDLFVNTALRGALGLADAATPRDQLHQRLGCVIGMAGAVSATWRRRHLDEELPLGAPLARLELARRLAGLPGNVEMFEAARDARLQLASQENAGESREEQQTESPAEPPAPRAPGGLPARITVSAYANLLACPYRFFATTLLDLREPDEIEETLSKRDYGIWVHRVLTRFHESHPLLQGTADETLNATLEKIADEVFAPLIAFNYLSLGWKLRLVKLFPAYLEWQREREAQGWRFEEGEAARVLTICVGGDDAAARTIELAGRIDRIDRHATDGSIALIDYKTQRLDVLKSRLRDVGEEAQLAGYAMFEAARGNTIGAAGLASIDGDAVGLAPARIDEPAERARAHLLLCAVEGGAALPANGAARVCDFCQTRGLCRKDYWSAAVPDAARDQTNAGNTDSGSGQT